MNAPPSIQRDEQRNVLTCAAALQTLGSFSDIIDVRSPAEYAHDHIPGALSAPVLDDAQRILIGTLHKQDSAFAAKRRGAVLVARNIATHIETLFCDKPRDWQPLVYCWRGGQRSGAMTHVLAKVGWRARQLEGGYRAYRRQVLADLETLPQQFQWRVITGSTGSGKSRLLGHIATAGGQALDLEALACHRGSVLGGLPHAPQPSQKMFESKLWDALRRFDTRRPIYVESESRKVGELRLPDALMACMRSAPCLRLELPLSERIALLRADYAHYELDPRALIAQLKCLTALHGHQRINEWIVLIEAGQWPQLVEQLLVQHYDPAYERSMRGNFMQVAQARVLSPANSGDEALSALARNLVA